MLLVRALTRGEDDVELAAALEKHVWAVSEGNPFVAVETIRALQQRTAVPDTWTSTLSTRVRELTAMRLERLSKPARRLASVAAVIGREFEFGLLQRASRLNEHVAAEGLEELVRRHVLRGAGERFDFTHHRVHAVVYEQLLAPQRKLHHRLVGEALETFYAANLEPHYLALGRHFGEGEAWEKAVAYFRRAGHSATTRSASRDAVVCFDQSLRALEHLPESPDAIRLALDLRLDLQSGYVLLGELPQMLTSLREAESFARRLGDQHRLARVWAHMAAAYWWMGQLDSAVDHGQRALAIATDLGDRSLEILARGRLGLAYLYLGEHRRAIDTVRPYTEMLTGNLARQPFEMAALPAVSGRVYLATSFASLGDFAAASAAAKEALEIATAAEHPYSTALAHYEAGKWRVLQGNFREAIPWLELSLEACRREKFYFLSTVATFAGGTYARLGRLAEGIALLEESAEGETATSFTGHRPANLALLGEAYLLSGRLEDALRTARASLDLGRAIRQRGFEAEALHVLGDIQSHQDQHDWAAAQESYQQARELAGELGMRPLVAHCHLGLGKLYRRTGKREQAHDHLSTATTMYREMGMTYWLEKAEAEMVELG
jgi:tetratricopeptide (TPR) repeat protein